MRERGSERESPKTTIEDKLSHRTRVFLLGEILERSGGMMICAGVFALGLLFWLITRPFGSEMRALEQKVEALSYLSDRKNEKFLYAFEKALWRFGLELRLQQEMLFVQKEQWEELKKTLNTLDMGEAKAQKKAFLRKIRGYMRHPDELSWAWEKWAKNQDDPLAPGFFSLNNWKKWLKNRSRPIGCWADSNLSLHGGFQEFFLEDLKKALRNRAWALEELNLPSCELSFGKCLALAERTKSLWKAFIQEVKAWEPSPDPTPLPSAEKAQGLPAPSLQPPETEVDQQEASV